MMARIQNYPLWLLAAALAFYISGNFVWNSFYDPGQLIVDTGWQAGLLWHNDYRLLHPSALALFGNESMHEIHISPFLVLFTYLSYLFPLQSEEWLSVFMALAVATLAAVFSLAATDFIRTHHPALSWPAPVAAGAGLIFSLNPIIGNILIYPHFEIWIPALLTLFLWAFAVNRRKTALIAFFLLLSVREDAGFHLCAILWTVVAWRTLKNIAAGKNFRQALSVSRPLLLWSAMAFMYSLITLGILIIFFSPPLKELSFANWAAHLLSIATRTEWVFSFAFLILAAAIFRRWDWLLGLVSCLPWILYNSATPSEFASTLQAYYAFPLIVALFWPLISHRFVAVSSSTGAKRSAKKRLSEPRSLPYHAFILIFAMITVVRPLHETTTLRNTLTHLLDKSARPPSEKAQNAILAVSDFFQISPQNVLSDDAFASFRPNLIQSDNLLGHHVEELRVCGGDYLIVGNLHYHNIKSAVYAATQIFGLQHIYRLRDSKYLLFSRETLCENGQCVGGLPLDKVALSASEYEEYEEFINNYRNVGISFSGCAMFAEAGKKEGKYLVVEEGGKTALLLPNLPMLEGKYNIKIHYEYEGDGVPELRVLSDDGNPAWLLAGESGKNLSATAETSFSGLLTQATVVVIYPGDGRLVVKSIKIKGAP